MAGLQDRDGANLADHLSMPGHATRLKRETLNAERSNGDGDGYDLGSE
jgi:hypothetical protein